MSVETALRICGLFGVASLLSIGGGNSVVPEIERQSVSAFHWLSPTQFADLFAIAQAAPGPSMLLVTLVGYAAAGVAGALLATVAMILPAGALVYGATRLWQRSARARWHVATEHGLAPIAVGLVLASGVVVARASDHSPAQYALSAVATVLLCTTRINPLLLVGAGAVLGWLRWV
jgi:chromate transporter